MGNSFTFNDIDMSGYGITVLKTSYPIQAPLKIDVQNIAFSGSVVQKKAHASKNFSIPVIIDATSSEALQTNLDSLNSLFYVSGTNDLQFDFFTPDRFYKVHYTGGLDSVNYLSPQCIKTSLNFISPSPYAYTTEIDVTGITIDSDPFIYTDIDIVGNTLTNPIIIISVTNGIDDITITSVHDSTNVLIIAGTYGAGDLIKIDSERFYVELSTDSGVTYNSIMENISGQFPQLKGNTTIDLTIEGMPDSGEMQITYSGRYL